MYTYIDTPFNRQYSNLDKKQKVRIKCFLNL